MFTYRQINMLTYCQSNEDHIDEIKETVKCLVKDYMSNQARTRLNRLLTDSSQYYKVESGKWQYVFSFSDLTSKICDILNE